MSDFIKRRRAEVYKDPRVQLLISRFMSGEVSCLDPTNDVKMGYHYPIVESISDHPSGAEDFLMHLFSLGILKRKLYDKILYCPDCKSVNVSVHYCCPYCSSFDIRKSSLIEHIKCGYIDTEENLQAKGLLVCPRCHVELVKLDVDYRKAGIWCTCEECNKNFDIPVTSHFCRDCHKTCSFESISFKDIYSYNLSAEARNEANQSWVLIAPLKCFFQNLNFKVESPGFLKGKSSTNHMFNIVVYPEVSSRKVIAIDIVSSSVGAVSEQAVISMFAKVYDVSPEKSFLIAIPKMNESGKKLATLYRINLIEAKDQDEVITAMRTLYGQRTAL